MKTMLDLKTPCYIIDKEKFENNIKLMEECFSESLDGEKPILGYSFKTNNSADMIKIAKKNDMYAEVVSDDEYWLATECGYSTNKIIFNGPQKSNKMLLSALKGGSIVNLDNFSEINTISENFDTLSGLQLNIGLRVNFDLENCCPGETTAGTEVSRFGFCTENGDFGRAVAILIELGIEIRGLHMHFSSNSRSKKIFSELSKKSIDLIKQYKLENTIRFVDIGGGFFLGQSTHTPGKPSIDEYADSICYELKNAFDIKKVKLFIEPGASLISSSVSYMSRIINQRDVRGVSVVTIDGSLLHINPFMQSRLPMIDEIYMDTERRIIEKQIICGSTCMENDRLITLNMMKELKQGDYIHCSSVGAYTMIFNNCFVNLPPYVYLNDMNKYRLLRDKKKQIMRYI